MWQKIYANTFLENIPKSTLFNVERYIKENLITFNQLIFLFTHIQEFLLKAVGKKYIRLAKNLIQCLYIKDYKRFY